MIFNNITKDTIIIAIYVIFNNIIILIIITKLSLLEAGCEFPVTLLADFIKEYFSNGFCCYFRLFEVYSMLCCVINLDFYI